MNIPLSETARNRQLQEIKKQNEFLETKLSNLKLEEQKIKEKERKLKHRQGEIKTKIEEFLQQKLNFDSTRRALEVISFSKERSSTRQERLAKLLEDYPALKSLKENQLPTSLKKEYDL